MCSRMNSIKAQRKTNRGNQRKHNRKITMRFLTNMMAIVLLFGCLLVPDIEAKADNLYIALSDTTVKIGDTITVSVTVPAGVSATVNLTYPTDLLTYSSASDTASANAGTVSMTIGSNLFSFCSNCRKSGRGSCQRHRCKCIRKHKE